MKDTIMNDVVKENVVKDGKNPVETVVNQLQEAEKKKKQDEMKKAVEEVMAAQKVLGTAVSKALRIQEEIKDISNNKLDLLALAKSLGVS